MFLFFKNHLFPIRFLVVCFSLWANIVVSYASEEVVIQPPSSCSFYGDFKQSKYLKGLDKPLESNGVFFFNCNLGVIWKNQVPVEETLVLSKVGKSSKIEQGQVIPLDSRQGKLLGQLINGLMGADSDFINDNFDVQNPTLQVPADATNEGNAMLRQSYILSPKSRSLSRAIKKIELVIPAQSANQHVPCDDTPLEELVEDQVVTISLLDRNDQWTHIVSNQLAEYPKQESTIVNCRATELFGENECQLLEQSQAQ